MRSPKDKFVAHIYYHINKDNRNLIYSDRLTSNDLEKLKLQVKDYAVKKTDKTQIIIKENKKIYPEFEWVEIENYLLK